MEDKQLYLQKIGDEYQFICQKFDERRIPIHEEFMFKEAAVVILYPDGFIDAISILNDVNWHLDYYKKLMMKSPRFASIVKKLPKWWIREYNTIEINKIMAKMGIVVIHNLDIPELLEEYQDREYFYSTFGFYGANKLTKDLEDNLNIIFANYPNDRCLYSKINKKTNEFEDEEPIKKR